MAKTKPKKIVFPNFNNIGKHDSRQIEPMKPEIRKEILERAVPKMIKNFNNGKCTFYDNMGIMCIDCPLNTLVEGLHCDLRAVLAVLIDDMAKIEKESKRKPVHKRDITDRFSDIT